MAWLSAVPDVRSAAVAVKAQRISRAQQFAAEKKDFDMPVVEMGEYLLNYLMEIGPVSSNGVGTDRVSHLEIQAWQDVTGIILQPWEAKIVRELSSEYAREMQLASDPERPSPSEEIRNIVREASAIGFEKFLNSFGT